MIKRFLHIVLAVFFLVSGMDASCRNGAKLYSIGSNAAWNSTLTWSLTATGPACGLIPQSDDTLIVNSPVILNDDFELAMSGRIEINPAGWLKGSAYAITLSGNSSLFCDGTIQLSALTVSNNASLSVSPRGKLTVENTCSVQAVTPILIEGSLTVNGNLDCGNSQSGASSILGTGWVNAGTFSGQGSIMQLQPAGNIPSGSVLTEHTWKGSAGSNWEDASNWSASEIPGPGSNVAVLPSVYQPAIAGNAYCRDLRLSPGSRLEVDPHGVLNVTGNLLIPEDAELLLHNTALSYASLITSGTVTGKIKSEIQVPGNSPILVSSPLTDALTGTFINMYLRDYSESTSSWGNYIVPTDILLQPMKGYELLSPYPATRIFEGTPLQGEVSQPVYSDHEGWNLLGNPFPSYIDWQSDDQSVHGWQRNNLSRAIYFPDPNGSGNYAVYVSGSDPVSVNHGSQYIPPMQGFFVRTRNQDGNSGSGVVKVNANARTAVSEEMDYALSNVALKFKIEGGGYSDETVIRFNPESGFEVDDDFDAYKLESSSDAPSLFSVIGDGTRLAVNTMPSLSSSLEIPMGVTCKSQQQLKLSVNGNTNFEYRYPLILEDRATGTFIDIRKDSVYVFDHSPSMDPLRFLLHFEDATGQEESISSNNTNITLINGIIKVTGESYQQLNVQVFGLDGKKVLEQSGIASPDLLIPFQGYHGVFIVTATTNKTQYARKLCVE